MTIVKIGSWVLKNILFMFLHLEINLDQYADFFLMNGTIPTCFFKYYGLLTYILLTFSLGCTDFRAMEHLKILTEMK